MRGVFDSGAAGGRGAAAGVEKARRSSGRSKREAMALRAI